MKTFYKSDDGYEFETEAECHKHECVNILTATVKQKYGVPSSMATVAALAMYEMHDCVSEMMKSITPKSGEKWVSNIGYNDCQPPIVLNNVAEIEVKYRNGDTDTGFPYNWSSSWRETDNHSCDIVAYKILRYTRNSK